jgi:hypothetical protein
LQFDAQTANFTLGKILTGATSGATAIILEQVDGGATGTLTLGNIDGTFEDNEPIADNNTVPGSATANGVVAWAYTSITGAPTCAVVEAIGTRLYVGRLSTDPAAVAYSDADTGTNPPFATWTVGTAANDPGQLNFRNAGSVNAIVGLGANIIVFSDFGKWSFYINVIDSAGTLVKVDVISIAREDAGGYAALVTPKGCFYVNQAGLWQLISVGQPNVPFSDQEDLASRLLGSTYFDDKDLSRAAIVYDAKRELVLLSCANDASANNYIVTYSTGFKSFTRFIGWNINCFLNDDQTIYAGSSYTGKVWECFSGFDDDGTDIWTEYLQELKTGDLETRQELLGVYSQGFLSLGVPITVNFDIYDSEGVLVEDKIGYTWEADADSDAISEYGTSSWGLSAWGGDVDVTSAMIESFAGGRARIKNYQRRRLHITAHGASPHIVSWVKLLARVKAQIRRRNLTVTT